MTYAYLGPEGTFTEAALRLMPSAGGAPTKAYPSVPAALKAVRSGECAGAVVPLENSIGGPVGATLGELAAADGELRIDGEVELPVTFTLMARPGTTLDQVKRIRSHPHAHSQCRRWIERYLPHAELLASSSTAAAAQEVAMQERRGEAAIAAPIAAMRYGLAALAADIGERDDAITRFISVRQAGPLPSRTGRDRSSLMVKASSPGALAEMLMEFTHRDVAMSWIQSWPSGAAYRTYHFFFDVDRHIEDADMADAVATLRHRNVPVMLLGSYPRAARRLAAAGKAVA